jgi:carboxymethylenebutenolidase
MCASGSAWSRREFLAAGAAAAAGYTLAAGPVRAAAIRTSGEGLIAGTVEIPVAGSPMPAYRAMPEGAMPEGATPEGAGPFPVCLLVHEIFGVHEYVRDVCRRLARQGYLALAPDLYRRVADVSEMTSARQIIDEVVPRVPDATVLSDLDAAREWAGQNGGTIERTFVTGFCWGGRIVWLYAAHQPDLSAGVAWYGRLVGKDRPETPRHPLDLAEGAMAPVLGLYGGQDGGIPLDTVEAMRKRLTAAGGESRIRVFPEAPHGFHADYRGSYREADAQAGWQDLLTWFRDHGGAH